MLLLHGETTLDWLQPLKEVLNPQYEGSCIYIRVFPAVSKVQYRMDARDICGRMATQGYTVKDLIGWNIAIM